MTKNIRVTDENGSLIGYTYPKRMRGLVKNGRAEIVGDCEIRMTDRCPAENEISEDVKMNIINFNAREWFPIPNCPDQKADRTFINSFDGRLVEIYMIGDWQWHWSEISSNPLTLEKNTDYIFRFWLNGGENDQNNEVCEFRILFNSNAMESVDRDNEYVYKLNRSFIKPIKRYKGWELYEIPFTTQDNLYTRLKFSAMRAYTSIMPALSNEAYADLPDEVDEFNGIRPQRHNIIFADGWPSGRSSWFSTESLKNRNANPTGSALIEDSYIDLSGAVVSEKTVTRLMARIGSNSSVNLSGAVIEEDDDDDESDILINPETGEILGQ